MTYGQAILGVSPSSLLSQRRAVAAAAAPASGIGGQNHDLALILADGSDDGRLDPAFEAHAGTIGQWALAIWERWLPNSPFISVFSNCFPLRLDCA